MNRLLPSTSARDSLIPREFSAETFRHAHTIVGERGEAIPHRSLALLERLDDAVFGALSGDPDALDQAHTQWDEACRTIEPDLLAETLREYRTHACEAWGESRQLSEQALPKGFVALEILELLADEFDGAYKQDGPSAAGNSLARPRHTPCRI